jgi:5'-methylthioadenosine phosphorylase
MRIGIIGGGHYWRAWEADYSLVEVSTPYGSPADAICAGSIAGHEVFTLQRHGPRHELGPTSIPWRANTFALASTGPDLIFHVTACGALTQAYRVGDVALLEQLIDFTRFRPTTMGPPAIREVAHLECAEPFDPELRARVGAHLGDTRVATIVTIEGPRFSTLAESVMFRAWGATLINMTSAPEVFLLAELGLRVIGLGLVTDHDTDMSSGARVSGRAITRAVGRYRDRIPGTLLDILHHVDLARVDGGRTAPAALAVDDLDLRPLDRHSPPQS